MLHTRLRSSSTAREHARDGARGNCGREVEVKWPHNYDNEQYFRLRGSKMADCRPISEEIALFSGPLKCPPTFLPVTLLISDTHQSKCILWIGNGT